MDYTQVIGNTNELKCMIAFIELGFECSIPYGNGAKYDFIADDGEKLYKIQCKSSNYVNDHGVIKTNAFKFTTTTQTVNTHEIIRYNYNKDQIDYFATSFNNKVYVVPVEECSGSKTLRFEPPENGATNYNKAEDYLITNIFSKTDNYIQSKEKYDNRLNNNITERVQNYCTKCNKPISNNSSLCVKCSQINSRKVERPDRDTFKNLIRTKSFCEIAKIFGVSSKSISKWCISYNLPSRKKEINNISDIDWTNI